MGRVVILLSVCFNGGGGLVGWRGAERSGEERCGAVRGEAGAVRL